MNFDDLEKAWKNQEEPELAKQNQQQIMETLRLEQNRFTRQIFWRDFREVAAAILAAVLIFVLRRNDEIFWPTWLAVSIILCVGGYLLWYARQWKLKEKQFDNSLRGELEKRSAQIGHQIRLLSRLVIWVYILPITAAIYLLSWQDRMNNGGALTLRNVFVPCALSLIVYAINWMAARSLKKEKRKVNQELEELTSS